LELFTERVRFPFDNRLDLPDPDFGSKQIPTLNLQPGGLNKGDACAEDGNPPRRTRYYHRRNERARPASGETLQQPHFQES